MSSTIGTTVKDFREPQPRGVLWFDPLLLLAALGLIACSVYVIGSATADDIPGQRYYYVYRQVTYGGVGIDADDGPVPLRLLAGARVEGGAVRDDDRRDHR